jgi:hypothetical protein
MIESRYLRNKRCVEAVLTAMEQIEHLSDTTLSVFPAVPKMPRELANKLIRSESVLVNFSRPHKLKW